MPETSSLEYWYSFAKRHLLDADARVLCEAAFEVDYTGLITPSQRVVSTHQVSTLKRYIERRCSGEPIAYIVGRQSFWRYEFEVSPATLIPRPETETLVELVLQRLSVQADVLDLGSGCGAIGLSIAAETGANVTLVDVSEQALELTTSNARRLALDCPIYQSNWYERVDGAFDCIVSNPPYVATDDPHLQQGDLRFEPDLALDGGSDGLRSLREVILGAPDYLRPDGLLAVEHGFDQADQVRPLFESIGFSDIAHIQDVAQHQRVTCGFKP